MSKVMVSMPDTLLRALDARARERGTTRSGLLQELAAAELERADAAHARAIDRLLDAPGRHGGDAAATVRRDRSR
jgi:metal-responsive CopG/Arc/MetJ family transcriptional regulator